ncbi:MAG: glycosyltransferase, partial [Planctomycetota bacterium]
QSNVDRSLLLFGGWKNGVCKPIEDKEEIMRIIKKNDEKLQNALEHFSPQLCLLGNIDFLSHSILQPLLKSGIPVIHHFGSTNPGYSVADTPKEELYIPAAASGWLKEQIAQQGYTFADFRVIYPGALVKQFKMNILPDMDKLRIAYASIVLPYKGPHILINALKKLHDMGIDFSCSLAGTSTDEKFVNSLKNFVTQTGMDEKVTFVGFLPRENLKNFLARHNVLAFPSLVCEAFGISQVEAMAAGLTVVTSGTGGAWRHFQLRRPRIPGSGAITAHRR